MPDPNEIPIEAGPEPNQVSKTEAIRNIKEQMAALERLEKKTGPSGAMPRATKAMLLDATEAVAKNPDSRVRWVNVMNTEKAQLRVLSGYKRLTEEQGGRQVGNLVLFAIPREVYESRVAELKKLHQDRLKSHRTEMEQAAENLAKYMRDNHGISVDVSRLLIVEGSQG